MRLLKDRIEKRRQRRYFDTGDDATLALIEVAEAAREVIEWRDSAPHRELPLATEQRLRAALDRVTFD